ncbi:MAG: hypothetical protein R6U55_16805, partial [Desulfovermiculus sp.]
LFRAMGVDPRSQRIRPDGWLTTTTMDELRELTVGLMREGLTPSPVPLRQQFHPGSNWRPRSQRRRSYETRFNPKMACP